MGMRRRQWLIRSMLDSTTRLRRWPLKAAVKCIVVHPICGADLKDEAEIRGPAAADPVPDRTRVKHHVQPFVFPGHGKKGIIGDPIPMETDLKSTGFLIRFQGNMGLSLPQGQREGAQMPGVLLQHIDAAVVVVQKAGLCAVRGAQDQWDR